MAVAEAPKPQYLPLTVLPCLEDTRRFYVLSERGEEGEWYEVRLGDESHCPTCECAHHRHRLAGTNRHCKHLSAAYAYRREHSVQCPACGEAMEHDLKRMEKGYLLQAVCTDRQCGYTKVL